MKLSEDNKVQTLTSRMGTGGGNVPLVMNTPKTLKIRSGCEGGGKGALIQDDKSATLGCNNDQTVFVPTAYGICSDKSNSMQSSNPHSGIHEADTSPEPLMPMEEIQDVIKVVLQWLLCKAR